MHFASMHACPSARRRAKSFTLYGLVNHLRKWQMDSVVEWAKSEAFDWHLVNKNSPFLFSRFSPFLCRAEGTNLLLDPHLICKKPRRLRGKLHDICKTDTSLMDEIARGISMGFRECEYHFKYRRWNCSSAIKRNMKKILSRGKFTAIDGPSFAFDSIQTAPSLSVHACARVHSVIRNSFDRHNSDVMISFVEHSSAATPSYGTQYRQWLARVLFTANWTFVCYVHIVNVQCARQLRLGSDAMTFRTKINWTCTESATETAHTMATSH